MRFFASICAALMIFASLSVVYADVAPYPRPRPPRPEVSQKITASINSDNRLSLKFKFPAACDYKFQLTDTSTGNKIHSGEGVYTSGSAIEVLDLQDRLDVGENNFMLEIRGYNFKEQTRFGKKIKRGEIELVKLVVITQDSSGELSVDIYDHER